ncbi:MAG: single-stranded DNA-binding protein [Candidatus Paceibacterota bacterium]
MNFNKAIVIGRVTKDPEIRTTPSGQSVATLSIATNRVWNNNSGERQEKTEFHNIVAWGKLAEICGQYLTKGQEVLFEGRMETRTWEGQDGQKRSRTEIIAENMQMGAKSKGTGNSGSYEKTTSTSAAPHESHSAPAPAKESENFEEEIRIEDIPF